MLAKKDRTLDEYKRIGGEMRLFKSLGSKLVVDISQVVSSTDCDSLMKALNRIDIICSRAEDNMFHDHPDLGAKYTSVFYGTVSGEPRNAVDEEMIERARQAADGLFA